MYEGLRALERFVFHIQDFHGRRNEAFKLASFVSLEFFACLID